MDALWQPGPHNGLTDIASVQLGHAEDDAARSGVSVLVFDRPATASVSILGQAPGTRDMAALDPARTVEAIDALVLAGGSAFGLAAADPVIEALASKGRGFPVGPLNVPIVPAAILFDLLNGGEKPRDLTALYRRLGAEAIASLGSENPQDKDRIGAVGAGFGATTGAGPGGWGMASLRFTDKAPSGLAGHGVAALVAVNAVGSPRVGPDGPYRAAPFLLDGDLGNAAAPKSPASPPPAPSAQAPQMKTLARPGQNTTIGCVITDITLDNRACHALATAGQDGLAAALWPAHTALDGDLVVGASLTGDTDAPTLTDPALMCLLQAATCACMARAITRGVDAALPAPAAPA